MKRKITSELHELQKSSNFLLFYKSGTLDEPLYLLLLHLLVVWLRERSCRLKLCSLDLLLFCTACNARVNFDRCKRCLSMQIQFRQPFMEQHCEDTAKLLFSWKQRLHLTIFSQKRWLIGTLVVYCWRAKMQHVNSYVTKQQLVKKPFRKEAIRKCNHTFVRPWPHTNSVQNNLNRTFAWIECFDLVISMLYRELKPILTMKTKTKDHNCFMYYTWLEISYKQVGLIVK